MTRDKKIMKIWHKDKEFDETMQERGQNGVGKQTVLHAWSCLVLFLFHVLVFTYLFVLSNLTGCQHSKDNQYYNNINSLIHELL